MADEPYNPPAQPGSSINISETQVQAFIDSVDQLNNAIRQIAGTTSAPTGAMRTVRSEAELQGEGEIGGLEGRRKVAAHNTIISRRIEEVVNAQVDNQLKLLKQYSGLDEESAKNLQDELQQSGKNLSQDMYKKLLEKFSEVVETQGTGRFSNILTEIEESGIRQLRFGELPLQDILRSAGILATRTYDRRYGPAAQQQAVEEGRPIPTPGLIGRAMRTLGPMLGTAGQFVGAADVVGDLARSYYDKGIGTYRELASSGQLTGQGFEAGLRARFTDPFRIWQPFGMLGFGQAREIVQQTREEGFTGPLAGRLEQGMATVVSHLGIQVGQASEFFTQSMREGGMSVGQVTQEMNQFHDATRNLNMNINDYTQQIMTSTDTLRSMGAGQAAPGLAQGLTAALPRAFRNTEGTSFLTGTFDRLKGLIAADVGHGANVINITSQRYQRAAWSSFDNVLQRFVRIAHQEGAQNNNDVANWLTQVPGSPLYGEDPNLIQQYLTRMQHGRGVTSQMSFARDAQNYRNRLGTARMSLGRLEQMSRQGIISSNFLQTHFNLRPVYGTASGRGPEPVVGFVNTITGQRMSPNQVRGVSAADLPGFDQSRLHAANRALLREAKPLLTPDQYQQLKQAAQSSSPFDVEQTLTRLSQSQKGPRVNVGTSVGTVTIELAKNAQGVFNLNVERQRALANGNYRTNQQGRP